MRKDFGGFGVRVACRLCRGKFPARVRRASVCLECDILERAGSGWTAERIGWYLDLPGWLIAGMAQAQGGT